MSVEGNISKKYGVESNITNDDLDYIADKLADMEFQTRLIDALNTASIYRDKAFWNDVVAMIQTKVTAVDGKGLSETDFTEKEKALLARLGKDYNEIYEDVKSVLGDENSEMGSLNLYGLQKAINEVFNRTLQLDKALSNKPNKSELGTSAFVNYTNTITDEPTESGLIPTAGAVVRYLSNIVLDNMDIKVDSYLSPDSENPVQNKVITKVISEMDSKLGQKANVALVRAQNADMAFEIADNTEHRVDGAVTNLGMAIYTTNNTNKFESSLFFVTGENPTPHIYIENFSDDEWILKFVGDDCNSDYAFTPISNTAYEINFKYIGTDLDGRHIILARVGAC